MFPSRSSRCSAEGEGAGGGEAVPTLAIDSPREAALNVLDRGEGEMVLAIAFMKCSGGL